MSDKSIPYYRVLMKREKGCSFENYELPEDFKFRLFTEGDEKDWAKIESSAGEFNTEAEALEFFQKEFLPYIEELKRRCIFIENKKGEKVATLTVWWCYTGIRRDPRIHWVAVSSEYQGLGLGKAIVTEGIKRLIKIEGDRDVFLTTQTTSYKAINIYIKAGFIISDEKGVAGYDNDEYKEALEILENHLRRNE